MLSNISGFKCGNKENVNGVSATKCTADKSVLDQMVREDPSVLQRFGATSLSHFQMDIWFADEGYPVKMFQYYKGKDRKNEDFWYMVELDVTEINSNFQISAPSN